MWADQATQRDLTNPLLPNSPGKNNKPTAPTVISDTDGSDRWFRPSDYEEDDAPPELRPERMSSLRKFRKFLHGYCEYNNMILIYACIYLYAFNLYKYLPKLSLNRTILLLLQYYHS